MRSRTFWSIAVMVAGGAVSIVQGVGTHGGFGGHGQAGGNRGGNRGDGGRQVQRPNISVPSQAPHRPAAGNIQRPNRPAQRPEGNRPNRPGGEAMQRPQNRPSIQHPSGGLKPSGRPGNGNLGLGANRPTTLPGNVGGARPGNRPNNDLPNINGRPGGGRPGDLVKPGNRPDVSLPGVGGLPGGVRPGNRPDNSLTNVGGRPGLGRPGEPGRPGLPGGRPGDPGRPGLPGGRPGAGDLGDFLGMQRPIGPGNRPGGERPPIVNRPEINRPQINRPINIGSGNTIINQRPSWANINNTTIHSINNQWQSAIVARPANPALGLYNWGQYHPARIGYWNGWATGVRTHWRWHNYHNVWFGAAWWNRYPYAVGGWHYYYRFNAYPSNYWWSVPAWPALTHWFVWNSAPAAVWQQPIYYDYGQGGNVTYQDNRVYIAGNEVASAKEFAQSAAVLATVSPPANEAEAEKAEWMALGTFAVSAAEKEVEPSRVLQLAVNKEGVIAGTLFNQQTDKAYAVQGQVDKETQRVAFRVGDSEEIVAETGLYHLTQDEAPVLMHFGTDKVENYLLVRLENSEPAGKPSAATPDK